MISPPNTACSGRLGFCAIYKHFLHSNRILLTSRIHARPVAANADRWARGFCRRIDI